MKKIYIATRTNLNEELLKETFYHTLDPDEADIIIAQSSIAYSWDKDKIVYVAVEPPLADHRLYCYSHFDEFHTVITHNPDLTKDNQFPFTKSDEAQFYPTNPTSALLPFVTREDTTIDSGSVFYAGMVGPYEEVQNAFYGINLTKVRRIFGQYLKDKNQESMIIGIGWGDQRTKVNDWRVDKQYQIKSSDCDFVLALENTMLPNYIYEKIWDGFTSDRVTLYLGDPNVDKHIPLNCFIDLRPYFNKETGIFDCEGAYELIQSITQEQYDEIIKNARAFRETVGKNHSRLQTELTELIIDRIKE